MHGAVTLSIVPHEKFVVQEAVQDGGCQLLDIEDDVPLIERQMGDVAHPQDANSLKFPKITQIPPKSCKTEGLR
jgi:hypothetical protein